MERWTFLRLLAEEAPVDEFEAVVHRARSEGAPANELEALQEEAVWALRVRNLLADFRRRESELAALYDTASDLTSLRDVEAVLQAIAKRARQLLAADMSYLMMFDEGRGDTYMRVADGTISASFGDIRLPLGGGLGGLVAQNATPYHTADYLADRRFVHSDMVDGVVVEEGIRAILGVPLQLGRKVIGVLFVAQRTQRHFAQQEVALLCSLGAHAAVAIENARLFQETQQALQELSVANEIVRAHSEAVERAAASHERLTAIVLQGGTVEDVARAVGELLDGEVEALDPEGRVLARAGERTGEPARGGLAEAEVIQALTRARTAGRTALIEGDRGWVAPIMAGSESLGALVLTGPSRLEGADVRTLERAAQITALLLLNQRSLAEAEQRTRGELLADLLRRPQPERRSLERRATFLAFDLDRDYVVVAVGASNDDRQRLQRAAAVLARERGGLAGEVGGEVLLCLPGTDASSVARSVAESLGNMLGATVTAGGSGPVKDPADFPSVHEEAGRSLKVLLALGRTGAAAGAGDLGPFALVLSEAGRGDLERFVEARLGRLLRYDAERGTELVRSLRAFFAHRGNLARTARALHVHVNTLRQRLDRVTEELGVPWEEPDHALELHLALRLQALREGLPDGSSS